MTTNTPDNAASGEVSQDELEDAAYREDDDYLLLDEEEEDYEEQDFDDREDSDAYPYNDPTQGPLPFSSDDPEEEKLWLKICDIAASGKEGEAIAKAIAEDLDDENRMTNEILFARHPELGRRKLKKGERALIKEWKDIRNDMVRPALRKAAADAKATRAAAREKSIDEAKKAADEARKGSGKIRLRQVRKGYSAYVGDRVEVVLRGLKDQGKLDIADADIEMLQRMANVETKGLINAVNSWDSVFMSAGFMQWPVLYKNPVGKLQRWIQRAPEAFARYGITLDEDRVWKIPQGKYTYTSIALTGAKHWNELRSREWAERFYLAGLDPDAVAAEAVLALEVTDHAKKRIVKKCGQTFLSHYGKSVPLRALIQETFNHRPGWLYRALTLATREAENNKISTDDCNAFLGCLHRGITTVYELKDKARSGKNLIRKTGRLVL